MIQFPDIAFIGKAGAGKTTAAELLVKYNGYQRLSFAAPLKDIARQLWGPGADKHREKLQRLGVAVRDIDEDTWADRLFAAWETHVFNCPGKAVVVDDCRFPNEYRMLAELGFTFVRVVAPQQSRISRLMQNGKWGGEGSLEHISETALDDYRPHYVIHNDGDLQQLADAVTRILNKEGARV